MTNEKHTKRALLASILSMLLCLSMLVGSTFAWFTDSVTSGKNRIVAGSLDVELEYSTKPGYGTSWMPVTEDTSLFRPVSGRSWEPGHTEVVYLRIHNAGSLALKYHFSVNAFGNENGTQAEKEYTNMAGDKFKLSNYLVFNQIDGAQFVNPDDPDGVKNREDLWLSASEERAAMGDLSRVDLAGALAPNEDKYLALAVYMPTWVGNEANQLTAMRETEGAPTVFLGLNLVATQDTVESDSFGTDYDQKAWNALVPVKVADAESLRKAIAEGGKVKLMKSIEEAYADGNETKALEIKTNTDLDLGNHTYAIQSASGQNGMIVTEGTTATISNGTIKMDKSSGSSYPVIHAQKSEITLENMTVELTADQGTCVSAGSDGGKVVIKGSAIKGPNTKDSNAVFTGSGSTLEFEDCVIIGGIHADRGGNIIIKSGDFTQATFTLGGTSGTRIVYAGTFAKNPKTIGFGLAQGSTVARNADGTWTVTAG